MPFFGGGTSDYKIVGTNVKGSSTSLPAAIGGNNIALGVGALPLVINGTQNIAIGNGAGGTLIDGDANFIVGFNGGSFLDPDSNQNVIINSSLGGGPLLLTRSLSIFGAASADDSIAIGRSSSATGINAIVIGQSAEGVEDCVSIGRASVGGAIGSVVIGANITDSGTLSVLIGDSFAQNVRIGAFDFATNPPLQVIEQTALPVTLPSDTVENTVLSVDVNAGLMRENSALFIDAIFQTASATGSLTLRLKADGVTIWATSAIFGTAMKGFKSKIANKNDLALNKIITEQLNGSYTIAGSPPADLTLDFNNTITFTVTAQKSNGADNINLAFSNVSFNQVA